MGERNHAAPESGRTETNIETPTTTETTSNGLTTRQKQVAAVLGGVTLAVVAGGVLMQFFTGETGNAAEGSGRATIATTQSGQEVVTRPYGVPSTLAAVAGQPVSYDAVQREAVERYGAEILEKLINRKIIENACATRGVSVSKDEVEQEVTRIAQSFNLEIGRAHV